MEEPTAVQTINLSAGVNWVSFNVETTLDDLKTALEGTDNTSITIAYLNQNTKYISGRWRGNLTFDLSRMYKITVDNACEITLEGMPVDPTMHPITITPGANWIGFPLDATMAPADAFAGFAVNGDVLSYSSTNARYTGGRWRGNCDLVGGHGYIYNSAATENRTLVFPAPSKARKMKP